MSKFFNQFANNLFIQKWWSSLLIHPQRWGKCWNGVFGLSLLVAIKLILGVLNGKEIVAQLFIPILRVKIIIVEIIPETWKTNLTMFGWLKVTQKQIFEVVCKCFLYGKHLQVHNHYIISFSSLVNHIEILKNLKLISTFNKVSQ